MRAFVSGVLGLLIAGGAGAQVVETPEPFDSAGRVMAITPAIAARLELRPPAWRITGNYQEARLYSLGADGYVIVVTRQTGALERYPITREEREHLRERTSTLPATVMEQVGERARVGARDAAQTLRNSDFVRNQTLLGLALYGPAFARSITSDEAGLVAAYLLAAGATFFGALETARQVPISEAQNLLATDAAVKGGLSGLGLTYALDANANMRAAAAFVGGIGGTAAGLYFSQYMNVDHAEATRFGSDALAVTTFGILSAIDAGAYDLDTRTGVAVLVAGGLLGYPLGAFYPVQAGYNVTAGDVRTLYTTGAIGAISTLIVTSSERVSDRVKWTAATAGWVAGLALGDRLLVRRLDHTRGEGNLVVLAAGAGALMGTGIYVLIDRERDSDAVAAALGTAGAIAGVALAERYIVPRRDAGRQFSRLELTPSGLAAAALGLRGNHPVLSFSF